VKEIRLCVMVRGRTCRPFETMLRCGCASLRVTRAAVSNPYTQPKHNHKTHQPPTHHSTMRIHAILFSMILCKRVTKKIDGKAVLSDVTLRIEPKECVCIVGEARAGKTTLFELLLKAQEPTSGSIEVDGVPLTTLPPLILQLYRSRLGVIFQEPRLLLHSTVAENIAFPLEIRGAAQSLIDRRVAELLKRFTLTTLKDQLPGDLSLSERALVGIARAFVASPLILMADEPLQALDEARCCTSKLILDIKPVLCGAAPAPPARRDKPS